MPTFRSRGFPMGALTRSSRSPRPSATSGNSSFTTQSAWSEFVRSSVASSPQHGRPPAEAVTRASRRRRPARSSTLPRAARGGTTRMPRGTSFHAGGRGRTSSQCCGRPRSSPATRWWTNSPRSRTSTSSRWAVPRGVATTAPGCSAANRSTRRLGQRRAQRTRRDWRGLQQSPPHGRVCRRAR